MSFDQKKLIPHLLLALALLAVPAFAQPSISVDVAGPFPAPGSVLLTTQAPFPGPAPFVTCGPGGLGIVPGQYNRPEVDALSNGRDSVLKLDSTFNTWADHYCFGFSVDEFANGVPGGGPNVFTEGSVGNWEASADIQLTCVGPGDRVPPLPPGGALFGHFSWLDGNGAFPFGGLGIGLTEPDPPFPGFPDNGDNVDAVDFRRMTNSRIYFSLDASYIDPIEGPPINTSTAAANAVLPGDVLVSNCGGGFGVYAPAGALGLGPWDDLDALILWENGDGVYQPSVQPFDWLFANTDMLLFSVRRRSPLIGTPDAFFGIPIEEGDILTTSPAGPGIFIAAEVIDLATRRSGTAIWNPAYGDDMDALTVDLKANVP